MKYFTSENESMVLKQQPSLSDLKCFVITTVKRQACVSKDRQILPSISQVGFDYSWRLVRMIFYLSLKTLKNKTPGVKKEQPVIILSNTPFSAMGATETEQGDFPSLSFLPVLLPSCKLPFICPHPYSRHIFGQISWLQRCLANDFVSRLTHLQICLSPHPSIARICTPEPTVCPMDTAVKNDGTGNCIEV